MFGETHFGKHSVEVLGLGHIAGLSDSDGHGRKLPANIEPQPKYAEYEATQVSPAFERDKLPLSEQFDLLLNRDKPSGEV